MTVAYSLLADSSTSSDDSDSWRSAPSEQPEDREFVAAARLLVVDDEPIVRSLVARMLEEEGHSVQVAFNGAQALQLAATDPTGFDLIITDIRMPGMDGWQLGKHVSERWPAMPVLYMSGLDVDEGGPGRDTLIRKPFDGDELLRRVRDLLRGR